MPVFRDYSEANWTTENALLGIECGTVLVFLQKAHTQSGFNKGPQANTMRSQTDDVAKPALLLPEPSEVHFRQSLDEMKNAPEKGEAAPFRLRTTCRDDANRPLSPCVMTLKSFNNLVEKAIGLHNPFLSTC